MPKPKQDKPKRKKPPTGRRRGGQVGNTNALKHGFYSRVFIKEELARLDAMEDIDPLDEIAVMRTIAHRIAETLPTKGKFSEDNLKEVNTLMNIFTVINTTHRTKLLARGEGAIADLILEALDSLDPSIDL